MYHVKMFILLVLLSCMLVVQATDLTCYKCDVNDEKHCPMVTNNVSLYNIETCSGSLQHVCAKFSIDLLSGESIVYRSCEPKYVGGTPDSTEFCQYHIGIFQPLIDNYLISKFECTTCNNYLCNT